VSTPLSPQDSLALARQHLRAGKLSAAAGLARAALRQQPDWPPALCLLSEVALKSEDVPGTISLLRRAVASDPGNARYHCDLASIYRLGGQLDEARREFETAISINPRDPDFYYELSLIKKFAAGDPLVESMEGLLRTGAGLPYMVQVRLRYALAKAYDDMGRVDDSFRHLSQGNALKRSQVSPAVWDEARNVQLFDRLRAVFDRALLEARVGGGYRSDLPVFIVGMPRSGTTLVEQILSSHPAVFGAGELSDLAKQVEALRAGSDRTLRYPDCVPALSDRELQAFGRTYVVGLRRRARNAIRITDKALGQVFYLGLIHLALPEARIIYVKRNPIDSCLSCFSTLFTEGWECTYELGELGRFYARYASLMQYWRELLPPDRFLEVSYEAVVADLETEARRLVAFCGLDWDPACLAFHEAERPVLTASAQQVRQPIYQTSRGRAERYRAHLGRLIVALGEWAPAE
jgi:tetratricopeptide (TPR) repeat protein